jgi:23S rRNA (guanosine2251-2'-O)-methyltransferase
MRDQRPREQGYGQRAWEEPGQRAPAGPSPAESLAENEEVVAGRRPVEEAFAARRAARRLLVVPDRRAALDQLVLHATTLRIPVVEVEGGTLTSVTGFDGHQGVALVVEARRWATIDEVFAAAKAKGEAAFVLVLDHLEDPQNVGTLLRSAEACGVHGVLFPTRGAAPISPAAVKTSAGAVEHLLLVPLPDLSAGLVDLHARGVRIVGADGGASMTVREADLRGPVAIVVGNEGRGLHANVRKRVDLMARIPMRGRVASLNASVAGSVFLFEAAAQRGLPEAEHVETGDLVVADTFSPEAPTDSHEAPSGEPVEHLAERAEHMPAPDADASETAISGVAKPPDAPGTEPAADALLPEAPAIETSR